jgi:hypothetical protein
MYNETTKSPIKENRDPLLIAQISTNGNPIVGYDLGLEAPAWPSNPVGFYRSSRDL